MYKIWQIYEIKIYSVAGGPAALIDLLSHSGYSVHIFSVCVCPAPHMDYMGSGSHYSHTF